MDVDQYFHAQYGLITRAQSLRCGLTERQIDRRLATGVWVRHFPGVYRHSAVRPNWETHVLAATFATDGLASHRCAAALWRLELYSTPPPEVIVPKSRWYAYDAIRLHQTTQWDRRDPVVRAGIGCTGIERTILDCGAVASATRVERLAESAIRQRHTSWTSLLGCLRRHSRRGRDGCLTLRRILEARLVDRTIPLSDFSRLIANLLVAGGVPTPVLEHRIVDDSGDLILQADLAWPSLKKAWELDGLRYHFTRDDVERDRRKRNRAKTHGWNIQEILWSMYVDDSDSLVTMAHAFLRT